MFAFNLELLNSIFIHFIHDIFFVCLLLVVFNILLYCFYLFESIKTVYIFVEVMDWGVHLFYWSFQLFYCLIRTLLLSIASFFFNKLFYNFSLCSALQTFISLFLIVFITILYLTLFISASQTPKILTFRREIETYFYLGKLGVLLVLQLKTLGLSLDSTFALC